MRGDPRQNPRVFYRESDFYRGPPSNRDWASFKSKLGGVKGLFLKLGNPVLPKTFLFLIPRNLQNFFFSANEILLLSIWTESTLHIRSIEITFHPKLRLFKSNL